MTRNIAYRLARNPDVEAIAALHVESWRTTYRGILPDAYLDHDVFADRAAVWRERFDNADAQPVTLTIVAELDGEMVGFSHSIADEDAEWGTLLDNLHVRDAARRLGIATRLVAETAAWLEERASAPGLYLWVLEENVTARKFYDALEGRVAGSGVSHEGGGSAPSLRYWWPRLDSLSSHQPQPRPALA